ncbi:MAG: addiction module protein [Gemmataceae bacterium]
MSQAVLDLLTAASKLSAEERHELADHLYASLDDSHFSPIDRMTDAEFEAEILRRAAESDRDPSVRIPWDQVRDMR